jgi:outer membrane protein assembly factor BamB
MIPIVRRCVLLGWAACLIDGGNISRADNWPEWRGATGQGISFEKDLPTRWGTNQNIRWKFALPEPGNSTPVVWKDSVFITQAVENRRTVMCFNRRDGSLIWQSGVTGEKEPTHEANPYCSGSTATDGECVYASFGSAGVCCYDFAGKELWRRDLGKQSHMWGVSASPVIYGNLCILNFGPGDRTFLVALNKKSGETVWQHQEPGGQSDKYVGSWATPLIVKSARPELIVPYPERVAAFDPKTGQEFWSCRGLNPLIYTSPLYMDGIVVVMGGYNGSALAVKAGGSGDVTATARLWQIPKTRQRIGSGVVSEGHVYILNDPGIAECFELQTGKLVWEERLKGPGPKADNWSSLVISENNLYAVNQSGDGFVFKADPKFQVVSTNSLGELTRASVAVSDGELFIRTYKNLWCISEKHSSK